MRMLIFYILYILNVGKNESYFSQKRMALFYFKIKKKRNKMKEKKEIGLVMVG